MREKIVVAGKHPVYEALTSGGQVKEILFARQKQQSLSELLLQAKAAGIKVKAVQPRVLDELYGGNHQGVLAVVDEFRYAQLEDVLPEKSGAKTGFFAIILDHIQDPHNLGAIIRTACVFGASCVILPKDRSAHVTATVLKVASGGCEHLPVVMVNNIAQTIELLQKRNVWVYAADLAGESLFDLKFTGDIAIVLGAEGKGISRLTKQKSDFVFSIPMPGEPLSLNVSVAAGVVMAEVAKQRLS